MPCACFSHMVILFSLSTLLQCSLSFVIKGDERDGDHFQFSGASDDGTYGGHARLGSATPGFEAAGSNLFGGARLHHESLVREGGESWHLSQELYATLAEAPPSTLIHLVSLYHEALLRNGLVEDAENITSRLAGLQNQVESIEGEELKGMDLLLKEGLLKYLLSIHPYLPPVPHQVEHKLRFAIFLDCSHECCSTCSLYLNFPVLTQFLIFSL